jgi:L-ascorbate metabolism protein UlaG (beta-lactamase superfamily)
MIGRAAPHARLALDFIGHSAVVVELDGVRLLTDPVTRARVGPLRRVEPVPARDRVRDIDAILISHLHWDHLDVPSLRDLGRDLPIFVPAGSGDWMRGAGFGDVREIAVGGEATIGGVVVRAVPAVHSGYRPPLGPTAPPLGYVIRGSRTVYFAGDTDLFDGMGQLVGADESIDMALIPVWGWGPTLGRGLHLDPYRAAQALRLIRPRAAVPIHWGTYWPHALGRVFPERLVEPPAAFVEYAAELAPDVQTVPTAVGDVVAWEA